MVAAQIALKLIEFVGNTTDKLSSGRVAYFWKNKQPVLFVFFLYLLF